MVSKVVFNMKLIDIIKNLNLVTSGNTKCDVFGIAKADFAKETDIAIVKNNKDILNTKANVLLTSPKIIDTDKTLIFSLQPETVALQIALLMVKEGIYCNYESPICYQMNNNMFLTGAEVSIGADTSIKPFTCIGNYVKIGKKCQIGSNVSIASGSKIGDGVIIRDGARVGVRPHAYVNSEGVKGFFGIGKVIIGDAVEIGYNSVIQRGVFSDTIIGKNTNIGDMVAVGHGVQIGRNCIIMAQVGIAGECTIGDQVKLYGQCAINNSVKIGDRAIIYGKTGVMKNVAPGDLVSGPYGRNHNEEMLLQSMIRRKFRRT